MDQDGNYTYANAAACSMLGYSFAELRELNVADINASEPGYSGPSKAFLRLLQQGRLHTEMELRRCDGSTVPVDLSAVVLPNGTVFASCRDISERKQHEAERESLELQLRQAQKMEAIGQLAGGVAHDFNNMLGVIVGHAEMALEEINAEDAIHANLQEIMAAAKRSADLTRQLLAFARKQTIAPVVQDLNATVESALRMLRRLVGEDIEVVWQPHAPLWPVKIDSGQVGQMLTNLVLNARDAIGGLGRIVIETGQVSSNRDDCDGQAERVPGDYVMLAVSDDGCGMDASVQAHLFEPFFTTKPVGQGTGLGLATVYGIVKQNHGFIDVDSEPGTGTTIRIYVPRTLEGTSNHEPQPAADLKGGDGETIILVEDEPAILRITQRMLENAGYTVLGASSPSAALQMAAEHGEPIDLLITDVVMPSMSGKDLAEQLRSMQPGLACLFMSGYTANIIEDRGGPGGGRAVPLQAVHLAGAGGQGTESLGRRSLVAYNDATIGRFGRAGLEGMATASRCGGMKVGLGAGEGRKATVFGRCGPPRLVPWQMAKCWRGGSGTMVYYLKLYCITLATFLAIDLVWLGVIARSFYRNHLGFLMAPSTNWWAASVFYLLFVLGIVFFVLVPSLQAESLGTAVVRGAFFGLITYATYDLTNLATLQDWPLFLSIVDIAWGTVLAVATSSVGFLAGKWLA